jgi:hypothetical protein
MQPKLGRKRVLRPLGLTEKLSEGILRMAGVVERNMVKSEVLFV